MVASMPVKPLLGVSLRSIRDSSAPGRQSPCNANGLRKKTHRAPPKATRAYSSPASGSKINRAPHEPPASTGASKTATTTNATLPLGKKTATAIEGQTRLSISRSHATPCSLSSPLSKASLWLISSSFTIAACRRRSISSSTPVPSYELSSQTPCAAPPLRALRYFPGRRVMWRVVRTPLAASRRVIVHSPAGSLKAKGMTAFPWPSRARRLCP